MAFEYKSTQAAARAVAPTINVAVDNSASKAFQDLQSIMLSGAKVVTSKIKAKADMQSDLVQSETVRMMDVVAQQSKRQMDAAGEDLNKLTEVRNNFNSDMEFLFKENLAGNPEAQKSLVKYYQTRVTNSDNQYFDKVKEVKKKYYKDNAMHQVAPIVDLIGLDDEGASLQYDRIANAGIVSGLTANEVAETTLTSAFTRFQLDTDYKEAVRTHDTSVLIRERNALKFFAEKDPYVSDKDYFIKQKERLDALEETMRQRGKTDLSALREAEQWKDHDALRQDLLDKGLLDPTADAIVVGKRNKAILSSDAEAKKLAAADIKANGWSTPNDTIINDKVKKQHKAQLTDEIIVAMENQQLSLEQAQAANDNNSSIYQKAWRSSADRGLAEYRRALEMPVGVERDQMVAQTTNKLNYLRNFSFKNMTQKQRLSYGVFDAITSGHITKSPQEVFGNLDSMGGDVPLVPSDNDVFDDLRDDLNDAEFANAQNLASGLKATGLTEAAIKDILEQEFKFDSVDGNTGEFSGHLENKLRGAGFTDNGLTQLEKMILDPEVIENFTTEARMNVAEVLNGEDVRWSFKNDEIVITNNARGRAVIPMTPEQMKLAAGEATKRYVEANPVTPLGQNVMDAGAWFADWSEKVWTNLSAALSPVTEPIGGAISRFSERVGEDVPLVEGKNDNKAYKLLLEQKYKNTKADPALTLKQLSKQGAELTSKVDSSVSMAEAVKGMKIKNVPNKLIKEAAETFDKKTEDEMLKPSEERKPTKERVGDFLKQIFDGVFPQANASAGASNDPVYNFKQAVANNMEGWHGGKPVVKKNETNIGYGHNISAAEEASGMIHGIRFKNDDGSYVEISQEDAQTIFEKDMEFNVSEARKKGWDAELKAIGSSWDQLDEPFQLALSSLAFQLGGQGASVYKKAIGYAEAGDVKQFAREMRRKDGGKHTKGMDNRVVKELYYAGLIDSLEQVKDVLPLATEKVGRPF